jgi:hypothetical protein
LKAAAISAKIALEQVLLKRIEGRSYKRAKGQADKNPPVLLLSAQEMQNKILHPQSGKCHKNPRMCSLRKAAYPGKTVFSSEKLNSAKRLL